MECRDATQLREMTGVYSAWQLLPDSRDPMYTAHVRLVPWYPVPKTRSGTEAPVRDAVLN